MPSARCPADEELAQDVFVNIMNTKQPTHCSKPLIGIFAWAILLSCASADDWPQYLGPNRNSTSAQKGILRSWPQNGPEVLWTVSLGKGFGGPVVKDGKVYLLDRDDKVGDSLRCFGLANGKPLWSFAYDAPGTVMFPGSRSVPTADGDNIYSCGHNGDLYCIDINTHKPVWKRNVWTDFGGAPGSNSAGGPGGPGGPAQGGENGASARFPIWAITQNPLIYGDLLIVASQAPKAGVVAYEKLTGNVKWTTPALGLVGYVSPAIVKVDGKDHVVMVTPSTNPFMGGGGEPEMGTIVGIEPLTGKIVLLRQACGGSKNPLGATVGYREGRMGVRAAVRVVRLSRFRQPGGPACNSTGTTGSDDRPPLWHGGRRR